MDEDRTDRILQRILKAIEPDQGVDGFEDILAALQGALVFQMSLNCSNCRKKIARKLRADIPAMLTSAGQLARSAQQEFGEHHFKH
jgi:hypothetical protein